MEQTPSSNLIQPVPPHLPGGILGRAIEIVSSHPDGGSVTDPTLQPQVDYSYDPVSARERMLADIETLKQQPSAGQELPLGQRIVEVSPVTPAAETTPTRTLSEDSLAIFNHRSAPDTVLPEAINEQTALDLFSYGDTVPGATGEAETPNARLYAKELVEMYAEHGEGLITQAESMVQACEEILSAVQIEGSGYSHSLTWSLWDMAKQRYMSTHPEAVAPEYKTRKLAGGEQVANDTDPLADVTKRWDIVDRHVGWEMQREALMPRPISPAFQANRHFAAIEDCLQNGERNATNLAGPNAEVHIPALRSLELSAIGEQVRLAALEIADGGISKTAEYRTAQTRLQREEMYAPGTTHAARANDKVHTIWDDIVKSRQQRAELLTSLYNVTTPLSGLNDKQIAAGKAMITSPVFVRRASYKTTDSYGRARPPREANRIITNMLVMRRGGPAIYEENNAPNRSHPTIDPFVNLHTAYERYHETLPDPDKKHPSVLLFHIDNLWTS